MVTVIVPGLFLFSLEIYIFVLVLIVYQIEASIAQLVERVTSTTQTELDVGGNDEVAGSTPSGSKLFFLQEMYLLLSFL